MPEIGMSVSMSGDGKRGVGHRPQATAPILDSTVADATVAGPSVRNWSKFRHQYQARLTMAGGATVARTRRPLPRKAAVAADMVWCL
jgi:hypothetical protein